MALPPKGDPARPLHLAASSATVLGVLALLGGGLVALVLLFADTRSPGGSVVRLGLLLATAFYLVLGTCFVTLAMFMRRRKAWAVIVTMVLVGMVLLMMAVGLLRSAMGGLLAENPVPALITVLVGTALIQMMFHLVKGYRFISSLTPPQGFTPIMAQPMQSLQERPHD